MKLSVSLPDEDVAVRMLRIPELEQDYQAAWNEWKACDRGRRDSDAAR